MEDIYYQVISKIKFINMKNYIVLIAVVLLFSTTLFAQEYSIKETIKFPSEDGLEITADLYKISKDAPWIILHHQAGFSRGEYLEIAPKLNLLGYNCIATDQRSGKEVNGIINQTHIEAEILSKKTEYVNAIPDLKATLKYLKSNFTDDKIIIWGSSYSAALTFYMASHNPNDIKAILAFSPGEYFEIDGKSISSFAKEVNCPVFITSAKKEEKYWKTIYNSLTSKKQFYLPTSEGFHGSRALWEEKEGHELVWKEVKMYLNSL